jgi:hypothetical protein
MNPKPNEKFNFSALGILAIFTCRNKGSMDGTSDFLVIGSEVATGRDTSASMISVDMSK